MCKTTSQASSPGRGQDEPERNTLAPGRDTLVFLVDDDDAVRDAVAISLRAIGFQVATYSSARQFLDAYDAGQRGCLVVDLDLPGVEPDLLPMWTRSAWALPAIVTSRRLRRRALVPPLTSGQVALLEKPFGIEDLLPLIQAALAAGRDEAVSGNVRT